MEYLKLILIGIAGVILGTYLGRWRARYKKSKLANKQSQKVGEY